MKKSLFTLCILISVSWIYAQTPGTIDSSFGGTGLVTSHIYDMDNIAYAVGVQADGKIIAAGSAQDDTITSFALIRYNSNGTPDASFGTGGIATPYFGNVKNIAYALAIQSDHKIVLGGYSNSGDYDSYRLARYNSDGTLDNTFGTGGLIDEPIGLYGGRAYAVAIQQDGKIIEGGSGYFNSSNSFVMVRYTVNGTVDSTFGVNGLSISMPGVHDAMINALKLLPNGKIIAVGQSNVVSSSDVAIARFDPSGNIDSTFGTNGCTTVDIFNNTNIGFATDVQADGKILVAGNAYSSTGWVFAILRFNADGTLDTQFANNGIDTLSMGGQSAEAYGIKVQTNGKIVVTGYSTIAGTAKFATLRLNSDGSTDQTFGNAGVVITSLSSDDGAYAMDIQSDGKIVIAGVSVNNVTYNYDFTLIRYFGDNPNGINELSEDEGVVIYPNPACNHLNILTPHDYLPYNLVSVYNTRGELVIQAKLSSGLNTVDIQNLTDGLYFIGYSDKTDHPMQNNGQNTKWKKLVVIN